MMNLRSSMMVVALAVIFCLIFATDSCPDIVERAAWGALPPTLRLSVRPSVGFVVIHHTSSGHNCTTTAKCFQAVREIQQYHQRTRKWSDIGYNFLIGGDGKIYEGRGWKTLGAHASGYNSRSVGIAFIGDYSEEEPSPQLLKLASDLIACGVTKKYISPRYNLTGHRQLAGTQCPGNQLYSLIKSWPHYRSKL